MHPRSGARAAAGRPHPPIAPLTIALALTIAAAVMSAGSRVSTDATLRPTAASAHANEESRRRIIPFENRQERSDVMGERAAGIAGSARRAAAGASASGGRPRSMVAAGIADTPATEAEARIVCGVSCHRFPPPDILPRAAWRNEIQLMARLREERTRPDAAAVRPPPRAGPDAPPPLSAPLPEDLRRVLAFYETHAPKALSEPEPWPAVDATFTTAAAPPQHASSTRAAAGSSSPPPRSEGREATTQAQTQTQTREGASERPQPARPVFEKHLFTPDGAPRTPAISNVLIADLDHDSHPDIVACDMRYGLVFLLHPDRPDEPMRLVSRATAPAHVAVTDVDGDGINDLLIADLGTFQPGDHARGAALWLQGLIAPSPSPSAMRGSVEGSANAEGSAKDDRSSSRAGRPRTLNFLPTRIGNLPRVADVEAADLDNDGVLDLVIAAFGWRQTGALSWLRASPSTSSTSPSRGRFADGEMRVLDPRAGAIHTIPVDLNRDNATDLVTVIAQEHEEVIALMNDGRGSFSKQVIYTAPHPNWGSSGIQVIDFDKDGDLDVLLTHGDMFDDFILKPYHGVQWLENRGTFPFTEHTLASLPGVHRALAVDLDGDDDLDVVAVTLVSEGTRNRENLPSIVLLEQTSRGQFTRHTLERGNPRHATLDVGDYDKDGDIDLVIGNMVGTSPAPWIEVWENLARLAAGRRAGGQSGAR